MYLDVLLDIRRWWYLWQILHLFSCPWWCSWQIFSCPILGNPTPPILSIPPVGHWRSEDKQPTKLYLLQENSVIGGQKISIQQSFIFCKKVQFLEVQADAIYMKLEFHFQIPFVLLCKDILGRKKNLSVPKKVANFALIRARTFSRYQ